MTELKTYDHGEKGIVSEDVQLSAEHEKDRLTAQADIAEGRINEASNNWYKGPLAMLTGKRKRGLDGYFDAFEKDTWNNTPDPWHLARQLKGRVFDVVEGSADEYMGGLSGSSAAMMERNLLSHTRKSVLKQIKNIHAGGIHSLQTLETLKGFTVRAMEKANTEREGMVEKQKEVIAKRGWFSRFAHKALAVGTLGAYNLVKTEKRQKWFNGFLEKSLKNQFTKINDNIATLEKKVGKEIAPMQSRIKLTLNAAVDPNDKADLNSELQSALRYSGDIKTMDLQTHWGIPNNNLQTKINFIEAARSLDFVKQDLNVVRSSREKEVRQKEMVSSASEQQNIFNDLNNFKFDEIKSADGFKDLPIGDVAVPTISELVKNLEHEMSRVLDVEKEVYEGNIKKVGLLTDSAKLVLLVKRIENTTAIPSFDPAVSLQVPTRQSLLAWIDDTEKTTGRDIGEWEAVGGVDEVKKIADDFHGITTAGRITTDTDALIKSFSSLDITDTVTTPTLFKKAEGDVKNLSTAIAEKKRKFENLAEKKENLPEKDKKFLTDSFKQVEAIRDELVKIVAQWANEKKAWDKWNTNKTDLKAALAIATHELTVTVPAMPTGSTVENRAKADAQARAMAENTRCDQALHNHLRAEPVLKDFSVELSRLHADLTNLANTDLTLKLSPAKNPSLGLTNERIQRKLGVKDFADEIDSKFVEQLEKNDQFDELSRVSKGTRVRVDYKVVAAADLRFPDQLGSTTTGTFVVVASSKKGVLLEEAIPTGTPPKKHNITILGPAVKDGVAYKNAQVSVASGTPGSGTSGAWDGAIALNYRISS